MFKGSLLCSQLSDLAEIQSHPSFAKCPYFMQERRRSDQNEVAKVATTLYINFSDTHGLLTLKSVAGFG